MRLVRVKARKPKVDPVVALLVSDIHLSLRPPVARAEEPIWFNAMLRPVSFLKRLSRLYRHRYGGCAVLVAGDIFDKWNAPAEVINWAIEEMPTMLAVPGNHDLPHHRPDLEYRSAFGTLVRAKKIVPLGSEPENIGSIAHPVMVYGQEFGEDPPQAEQVNGTLNVLVTHQYLWTSRRTGHVGAPPEARLDKVAESFEGYDVVAVGDNHVAFERRLKNGAYVHNCGTLMRRKTSEVGYVPRVGVLRRSGKVDSVEVPHQGRDKLSVAINVEQAEMDANKVTDFVRSLEGLEDTSLDFRDMLRIATKDVSKGVREAVLEALG